MDTNGKVAVGFVLGALFGVAAGLLVAPTTGLRTRKNLNKKAKKLVKQIEGLIGKEQPAKGKKTQTNSQTRTAKAKIGATI